MGPVLLGGGLFLWWVWGVGGWLWLGCVALWAGKATLVHFLVQNASLKYSKPNAIMSKQSTTFQLKTQLCRLIKYFSFKDFFLLLKRWPS